MCFGKCVPHGLMPQGWASGNQALTSAHQQPQDDTGVKGNLWPGGGCTHPAKLSAICTGQPPAVTPDRGSPSAGGTSAFRSPEPTRRRPHPGFSSQLWGAQPHPSGWVLVPQAGSGGTGLCPGLGGRSVCRGLGWPSSKQDLRMVPPALRPRFAFIQACQSHLSLSPTGPPEPPQVDPGA